MRKEGRGVKKTKTKTRRGIKASSGSEGGTEKAEEEEKKSPSKKVAVV